MQRFADVTGTNIGRAGTGLGRDGGASHLLALRGRSPPPELAQVRATYILV